jgi:hypothetical protein
MVQREGEGACLLRYDVLVATMDRSRCRSRTHLWARCQRVRPFRVRNKGEWWGVINRVPPPCPLLRCAFHHPHPLEPAWPPTHRSQHAAPSSPSSHFFICLLILILLTSAPWTLCRLFSCNPTPGSASIPHPRAPDRRRTRNLRLLVTLSTSNTGEWARSTPAACCARA